MMRATALTILMGLLLTAPAIPQTVVPIVTLSFPSDLRQYLSLTDTQLAAIGQMNSDYNQVVLSKQSRNRQLQIEIADQSSEDPEDPMAIGVRYAELESIRRDLANQLTALRGKLQASLADAQQAKLKTLDDARKLQPLVAQAFTQNLLNIAALPVFGQISSGTGFLVGFSSASSNGVPSVPAELQQYLSLSGSQVDAIDSLNSSNQQLTSTRRQRIAQLQAEIVQETAKDPIDPLALGTRYVEIDAINRDISADRVTLRGEDVAVLNDAQRAKLSSLAEAQRLQTLISEAQCENLLDSGGPPATAGFINTFTVIYIPIFTSSSSSCGYANFVLGSP